MPLEIATIPCLEHNYAFLLHDAQSGETAVVDVPEAETVSGALKERGWSLSHILITHHHRDHSGGVVALHQEHPSQIIGASADAHRLPDLHLAVSEGESFEIGGEQVQVLDVSGHTRGHIAFYFPDTGAVASGDSLMALGCGRVYGDGPAQMFESLQKIAELPPETLVLSGHEFTEKNANFALTLDPENEALKRRAEAVRDLRGRGLPTIPSKLSDEYVTNPFLRCDDKSIQRAVGLEGANLVDVFTEIRARKNKF
ncbi:hydroxyacylglutathione hydrolase [Ruegeria sp. Ofav3-42]|uniref:hydroxyacylglutathione hydrolase n=1 Tax=Ruegeria sp. Ofav3-42 TaxID=2917759 RepID=UPI001EF6B0BD|nr:hydroxyacylglutathione hydrolase [Ruegeria sp. Ofav3-42]MCG7522368.1 hydroxyacylglutathione hydrolase [Ruegeria sp. Ofav3-42]